MAWLDLGTFVFGIAAAYYWLASAWKDIPPIKTYFNGAPADDPFFVALTRAAKFNRRAAMLTGLSVLCVVVKASAGWWWWG